MTLPELMGWAASVLPFAFWLFAARTRGVAITISFWSLLLGMFLFTEHQSGSGALAFVLAGFASGSVQASSIANSLSDWFLRAVFGGLTLLVAVGVWAFVGASGLLALVMLMLFAVSFGQLLALQARSYNVLKLNGGYED